MEHLQQYWSIFKEMEVSLVIKLKALLWRARVIDAVSSPPRATQCPVIAVQVMKSPHAGS